MNSTLKMLLPTTLPTAMSRSPRSAAVIDVATSGSDVPAATIVRLTVTSSTPAQRANATAPSTSQFEPITSIASPASTKPTFTSTEDFAASAAPYSASYSASTAFVSRRLTRMIQTV